MWGRLWAVGAIAMLPLSQMACGDDSDGSAPGVDAGTSGGDASSPSNPSGSDSPTTTPGNNTDTDPGSSEPIPRPSTTDAGGAPTPPPDEGAGEGELFGACDDDDDCGDGLNCYEFGGYCGTACAEDAECESQGSQFSCSGTGGGGFPGGGFPGGGGATDGGMSGGGPVGVCRAICDGEDDATSCPEGLECISVGGGFMGGGMGGSFRCVLPDDSMDGEMDGEDPSAGDVAAYGECSDDGDCADGFGCVGGGFMGGGGSGYCSQECDADEDCTEQPGSGSVTATCGFGGQCTLSCEDDSEGCPDGMDCMSFGGGGGFATCVY